MLTTEEIKLLSKGTRLVNFFRDGLKIFGASDFCIEKITPSEDADVLDLTKELVGEQEFSMISSDRQPE